MSEAGGGRKVAGGQRSPAGGKSGLHRTGRSITPTRGDPRESATEMTPPMADDARRFGEIRREEAQVRVKSWSKSPRATARRLAARQAPPGASSNRDAHKSGPLEGTTVNNRRDRHPGESARAARQRVA